MICFRLKSSERFQDEDSVFSFEFEIENFLFEEKKTESGVDFFVAVFLLCLSCFTETTNTV